MAGAQGGYDRRPLNGQEIARSPIAWCESKMGGMKNTNMFFIPPILVFAPAGADARSRHQNPARRSSAWESALRLLRRRQRHRNLRADNGVIAEQRQIGAQAALAGQHGDAGEQEG